MHISFLAHRRYLYLKLAVALCLVALALYIWHQPFDSPNGGTWLGYGLGTLSAALIVLLTWFGVRKRRYQSNFGTVKGWLSAHVYLGLALLLLGTLHTGFQFGWNVHTLAYGLMVAVIVSGIYGIIAYQRYPELVTREQRGRSREELLAEVADLDREALNLSLKIDDDVHAVVLRSIQNTVIGGNAWQQLRAQDPNRKEAQQAQNMEEQLAKSSAGSTPKDADTMQNTIRFMAGSLASSRDADKTQNIRRLLALLAQKRDLIKRLRRIIQLQAMTDIWLFFHVPMSIGLLAALVAHIVAVFFYW